MLLDIHRAHPDELGVVLDLLDEAAAWLQNRGIRQWPAAFSDQEGWRQERLRSYLTAGQTWVAKSDGEPIATFTLSGPDPDFAHGWPGGPGDALYLYRMAVRRRASGAGLGERILDWCSAVAAGTGHSWLRLDCHRENPVLQQYYANLGFTHVGTVIHTIPGTADTEPYVRGSGALFQRTAGSLTLAQLNTQTSPAHESPACVGHYR